MTSATVGRCSNQLSYTSKLSLLYFQGESPEPSTVPARIWSSRNENIQILLFNVHKCVQCIVCSPRSARRSLNPCSHLSSFVATSYLWGRTSQPLLAFKLEYYYKCYVTRCFLSSLLTVLILLAAFYYGAKIKQLSLTSKLFFIF